MTSEHFTAEVVQLDNVSQFKLLRRRRQVDPRAERASVESRGARPPTTTNTFGFLLIDGLSCSEEVVVSLASSRRWTGSSSSAGSSADDINFKETFIYSGVARSVRTRAVMCLIQTDLPFEVFRTQHFVGSDKKMVVTGAVRARAPDHGDQRPAGGTGVRSHRRASPSRI